MSGPNERDRIAARAWCDNERDVESLAALFAAARAEEREQCAKIARTFEAQPNDQPISSGERLVCEMIAAKIMGDE